MPVMQLVNGQVSTTSVNAQTNADTALTPASTVGFPAVAQFTILERQTGELLLVTATGATWTVQRGYSGTTAMPIVAGDNLDYSITREMLLAGFVTKIDEQSITADTASGVLTLNVPSGISSLCQGLRVVLRTCGRSNGGGNTYLLMRLNGDTSTSKYGVSYAYWGSGSGSGNFSGLSHARIGWAGYSQSGGQVTHATHSVLELSGCFDTALWTAFTHQQRMRDGSGAYYRMETAGHWEDTSLVTSLQFSMDASASNGTWAGSTIALFKGYLYGVP